MFKTYLRLLNFAKPLSRYTVPYFFFAALHALFNTFNYAMIIPILTTMFNSEGMSMVAITTFPGIELTEKGFSNILCYLYGISFGSGEIDKVRFMVLLGVVTVGMNLLSNLFRYASAMTVERLRVKTIQRMRDEMF